MLCRCDDSQLTLFVQEGLSSLGYDDQARDELYERAEKVGKSLLDVGDELRSCIDNVNASSATASGDGTPLGTVVRILNNQLQALTFVDEEATKLTRQVEQLTGRHITQSQFDL